MDRRGFLRGVFGGVTAAGLVVSATPSEIEAFTRAVAPSTPLLLNDARPQAAGIVHRGETLYNERGERVAIVTGVGAICDQIETTCWGDANQIYVPGRARITLSAECVGDYGRPRGRR